MSYLRQSPLILFIGGIAGVFFLLSLNRTSPANRDQKADVYMAKMQLALTYMQQGQNPMAGVKLFRKITEEYPKRYEAPFQLGTFAMNTGQYQKAASWFAKASTAASGINKIYSLLSWSDALVMSDKKDSAVLILQEVNRLTSDTLILRSVRDRINALK